VATNIGALGEDLRIEFDKVTGVLKFSEAKKTGTKNCDFANFYSGKDGGNPPLRSNESLIQKFADA